MQAGHRKPSCDYAYCHHGQCCTHQRQVLDAAIQWLLRRLLDGGSLRSEAVWSVGQASPQHHRHVVDATNTARRAVVHTAHVHVAALAHC